MAASSVCKDIGSAEWAGLVVVNPLLDTISMKYMFAGIYLIEIITDVLHKSGNTDAALLLIEII
jgi:hypothetical protein